MTNEEMREVQITREEIYDGIVLHVTKDTVRLPNGGTSIREVAWHRGAVCVVPVTEDGEIIFVEQFRYAMDRVLLEIPAGKLEAGETDRAAAARRELSEEPKCIKLEAVGSPIPVNMWIQIIPNGDEAAKMRVVVKAEINFMLRSMIEKPLKEGIEKMAEALSLIAY